MKNLNLTAFLYLLLSVSLAAWMIVAWRSHATLEDLWSVIAPISQVVTVDALFIGLFIKWGWRWKPLHPWLVPFPDLNGTWLGELQTDWKDDQGNTPGPIPIMLTIKQSLVHVSCVVTTGEMKSFSYSEGFRIDEEKQIREICYTYTSRPNLAVRDRSVPHDGTALLRIVGEPPNKLQGEYWTQRKTAGTMKMSLLTRKILHELPPDTKPHPVSESERKGTSDQP